MPTKTRILEVRSLINPSSRAFFLPQYELEGIGWVEFYGLDADSPYLHAKTFDTIDDARAFLKAPSIIDSPHLRGQMETITTHAK